MAVATRGETSINNQLTSWDYEQNNLESDAGSRGRGFCGRSPHVFHQFLSAFEDSKRLRTYIDHLGLGLVREDREMHEVTMQLGLESLTDRLSCFIEQGNACEEFCVKNPRATALIILLLLGESFHRVGTIDKFVPRTDFEQSLRSSINQLLERKL